MVRDLSDTITNVFVARCRYPSIERRRQTGENTNETTTTTTTIGRNRLIFNSAKPCTVRKPRAHFETIYVSLKTTRTLAIAVKTTTSTGVLSKPNYSLPEKRDDSCNMWTRRALSMSWTASSMSRNFLLYFVSYIQRFDPKQLCICPYWFCSFIF